MKVYRKSRGETEHYTSLEELRECWGLRPVVKQTKNKVKLSEQREKFLKEHLCPICKKPMEYIGGNQLACKNELCKGKKHEIKDKVTGETKIWYTPVYYLLNGHDAEYAQNIFAEIN